MINFNKPIETEHGKPALLLERTVSCDTIAYMDGTGRWHVDEYTFGGVARRGGAPDIRNVPETVRVHVWKKTNSNPAIFTFSRNRNAFSVSESIGAAEYRGSYPVPLDELEKGDD